jgi:hypothetical protein
MKSALGRYVVMLVTATIAVLAVFAGVVPESALAHPFEGDIVMTPDGFTAPADWTCSSRTDGPDRYVYCSSPDHPRTSSGPGDYVCSQVTVTATSTRLVPIHAGSWCTSMAVSANCNTTALEPTCFDEYGTWGQMHGAQVGCHVRVESNLLDMEEDWSVVCHSLVEHIEDVPHVDLAVTEVRSEPAEPQPGQLTRIVARTANIGNVDAGAFTARLEFAGYFIDVSVPGIAAGSSVEIARSRAAPSELGTYRARGLADIWNTVRESVDCFTETAGSACNNARSADVRVVNASDTTPPQSEVLSGPPDPSNGSTATFEFSSSEGSSSFKCQLDSEAPFPCTSPATYSGLADGSHTFEVAATDPAGNTDPTPASWSWVVDTSAPETGITGGPSSLSNQTSATFSLSSNEGGSAFECRLNGSPYVSCSSPKTYSALSDGTHTFEVRSRDVAGNVDLTPAAKTWTVDTVAPASPGLISPANGESTSNSKPTFEWSDVTDSSGVTYQIQLDNSGSGFPSPEVNQSGLSTSSFTPSSSLPVGTYSWRVRASDGAGNIAWSAVSTVTITTPPGSIDGTVTNQTTKKGIAGATVNCGSAGTATTASNGSYSITNVAPGSYTCTASASGFKSASKSVTVSSNSTSTAGFALRKA